MLKTFGTLAATLSGIGLVYLRKREKKSIKAIAFDKDGTLIEFDRMWSVRNLNSKLMLQIVYL